MMAVPVTSGRTLGDLLGARAGVHARLPISDIALNSSAVQPGCLFVAVAGQRSHGLKYAAQAVARGAVAIAFEPHTSLAPPAGVPAVAVPDLSAQLGTMAVSFFGQPAERLAMAAVTGTNGKTTVAYLVASAMAQLERRCGYLGTLGVGVPPDLAPGALTTPDCFQLHRHLSDLSAASARYAALEISSHALDQGRAAGVNYQTAVFTNLSRDHLDYHGDLDRYGRSKAKLFASPGLRQAIINVDDAFGAQLAAELANRVPTLAITAQDRTSAHGTDVCHGEIAARSAGLTIRYRSPWGDGVMQSELLGAFNGQNLLLALAVLSSWNVDHAQAAAALGACGPPPGRMEAFRPPGAGGPLVVVDFAHTPAALAAALNVLRPMTQGRLWCVFGCGGDRDAGKRPLMGAAAAERADAIFLTSDNPRSEAPDAIVAQIQAGCAGHGALQIELNRSAAIASAIAQAAPEDTVLVAGRGHETWQQVNGRRLPLSDRAEVAAALGGGP
jgi:UDP-N-acetylmuramoyl-L-alanyl-D-glutamate--2,6-diaminopimelate ligase